MKQITLKIGKLFDFCKEKYDLNFEENKMIAPPFKLKIKDEKGTYQNISKFVCKKDDLYETHFDDLVLYAGSNHRVSLNGKDTIFIKNVKEGDRVDYLNATCTENKKILDNQIVYDCQIDTDNHLYITTNGLIHHNTTEIENKAKDYLLPGWELVSESGVIGNSLTAIVPFMYKNSQQKIIILDDINTIFRTNYRDPVLNFLMAVLDKKAATSKPIKIDKSQTNRYNNQLQENIEICIDKQKLKEGIFSIKVDGETVFNEYISLKESQDLYHKIKSSDGSTKNKYGYLREVSNKDFMNDIFEEEDDEDIQPDFVLSPDESDESPFDPTSIPEKFTFNSRVIMITNVKMSEINQAFRDRCLVFFIELSVDQYIERLDMVLPKILKDDMDISGETLDWAKQYTYQSLVGALRAFKHNYSIPYKSGGKQMAIGVEINRDLTFRLFEELVQKWIVFATKRLGNNIKNKVTRDEMSSKLVKPFVILYVIPFLKAAA